MNTNRRGFMAAFAGALALLGFKPKSISKPTTLLHGGRRACGTSLSCVQFGDGPKYIIERVWPRPCGSRRFVAAAIAALRSADTIPANTPVYWTEDGRITTRPT